MRGVLAAVLTVAAATGLATTSYGQDDEVRRLREKVERLEAENEALKDQLVKLRREAKARGDKPGGEKAAGEKELAAAKASLATFCEAVGTHRTEGKVSGSSATKWRKVWYNACGVDATDLRRSDSPLNPIIAEIGWAVESVTVGPFNSAIEAAAATYPLADAKPIGSDCKAKLALRDGKWHLIELQERHNGGEYRDVTATFKGGDIGYLTTGLKAALDR